MSKPARPPPPMNLKKVLPTVPSDSSINYNAPSTPTPKPSVKPKPKLAGSPAVSSKKPQLNRSLSTDLLGDSTGERNRTTLHNILLIVLA